MYTVIKNKTFMMGMYDDTFGSKIGGRSRHKDCEFKASLGLK